MILGIIGESCTGKTTIVNELKKRINVQVYTGKDYLKIHKNPSIAEMKFKKLLAEETQEVIVYIITEKDHFGLLPQHAKKVLVTAELEMIKERFKTRMRGNLPQPVEMMIEKKHGMFDNIEYELHLESEDVNDSVNKILTLIQN